MNKSQAKKDPKTKKWIKPTLICLNNYLTTGGIQVEYGETTYSSN